MIQLFKTMIPATAILFATACGNGETSKEVDHSQHGNAAPAQSGEAAPQATTSVKLKNDNLNAVYQHYIHLTTALTNEDAAEAKVAANAIEAGAKQLEGGASIASTASKITTANDIEAQRKAYSTMSNDMIALIKKSGLDSGEVYVDHCPMAFDNKGASWLSNSKEIRNPYFGEKMMNCGEVTETIK